MGSMHAMHPTFQREDLHPFWEEALPLFKTHWRELAEHPDIALEPSADAYDGAERAGILRVFTVRGPFSLPDGIGELMGYAVMLVSPHPHSPASIQAKQDALFLHPDYRSGNLGIRLVKFIEDQLRAEGVQVIYHHVKHAHPALGSILHCRRYQAIETVFAKRLDLE